MLDEDLKPFDKMTMGERNKSAISLKGRAVGIQGLPSDLNPYAPGSTKSKLWRYGWMKGKVLYATKQRTKGLPGRPKKIRLFSRRALD